MKVRLQSLNYQYHQVLKVFSLRPRSEVYTLSCFKAQKLEFIALKFESET